MVKISFPGVGAIERHSGFKDPTMTKRLKEMCRVLYEANREDILRDLAGCRVSFRDVWSLYRRGKWEKIPTPQHWLEFATAFTAWYPKKPKHYQADARTALNQLSLVGGRRFRLDQLVAVLVQYRDQCEAKIIGAQYNRTVAMVRAFLKENFTTDHVLYRDVARLETLKEHPKRQPNPQLPAAAWAIRETLGGWMGEAWWIMCATGMMPDEYFNGKWALEDGRLHIKGTKRLARERFAPLLTNVLPATRKATQFAKQLRKAGLGVRPYDGRHSFGLWCTRAGVPDPWKAALLGHQASLTQRYGWEEGERVFVMAETMLRKLLQESGVTVGDTPSRDSGVTSSGPTRNRTENLLIKSPFSSASPRNPEATKPEGKRTK